MFKFKENYSVINFIFENEDTKISDNIEFTFPPKPPLIDIQGITDAFIQKQKIQNPLEWKIYDPQNFIFKVLDLQKPLNRLYLYSPVIMLKYRQLNFNKFNAENESEQNKQQKKLKLRNKERTIRDVLQCVKKWRKIHIAANKSKTKVSLDKAAKIIGVAKKSLDDYFSQLKFAQKYGFDFEKNIDQKMGVLRTYVRNYRFVSLNGQKQSRLPKELKAILELYSQNQEVTKNEIEKKDQQSDITKEAVFQNGNISKKPSVQAFSFENQEVKGDCFSNSISFIIDSAHESLFSTTVLKNDLQVDQLELSEYIIF